MAVGAYYAPTAILACDGRVFILTPYNSTPYQSDKTGFPLATLAPRWYTTPMNKQAILSHFLSTVHGKRLISRGLQNTQAYYNLPQGVVKANAYGDATLYPRHEPAAFYTQHYYGQLDVGIAPKQLGAF